MYIGIKVVISFTCVPPSPVRGISEISLYPHLRIAYHRIALTTYSLTIGGKAARKLEPANKSAKHRHGDAQNQSKLHLYSEAVDNALVASLDKQLHFYMPWREKMGRPKNQYLLLNTNGTRVGLEDYL